jgi:hypothetical protein
MGGGHQRSASGSMVGRGPPYVCDSGGAMARWSRVLSALVLIAVGMLFYGDWRSSTHAAVNIRIEDYGMRTSQQLYGSPHPAAVEFFSEQGNSLAKALSVEPLGYLLAVHPDAEIRDCRQYQGSARRKDYARCFDAHSRWVADWAPRVSHAEVRVGDCRVRDVPVVAERTGGDWWLWWVPLPHVGGAPLGYFDLSVAVDRQACTAANAGSKL